MISSHGYNFDRIWCNKEDNPLRNKLNQMQKNFMCLVFYHDLFQGIRTTEQKKTNDKNAHKIAKP